jgi:hypothetical protein
MQRFIWIRIRIRIKIKIRIRSKKRRYFDGNAEWMNAARSCFNAASEG